MLRFQDLSRPRLPLFHSPLNSQGFLPKERAKSQTAVVIPLAQIDARAEARALGRRPVSLIHHWHLISDFYFQLSALAPLHHSAFAPKRLQPAFRFLLSYIQRSTLDLLTAARAGSLFVATKTKNRKFEPLSRNCVL